MLAVRDARPEDAAPIAAIYNHAVETTTAVWNDRISTALERAAWAADRQNAGFAVLVAEVDRRVVGYASYGAFRPFDGYRHTVENSVYVAPDMHGRGLGLALLQALIARAKGEGRHVMIAGIEAGNEVSIRLHRRLGFVETARMPQVGCKFGRWLDLAFLQLTLDNRPAP